MHVAAAVRREKEAHPERFCAHPRCLWRVVTRAGRNPCRNHPALNNEAADRQPGSCDPIDGSASTEE